MKGFLLTTLMIFAGVSVLPAHAQELLWEPKESLAEDNKDSINKNIKLLQWEARTDTERQLRSPSDNQLRKDNITWEILPHTETERKNKNLSPNIATETNSQNESLSWEAVAPEDVIMEEEGTTTDKNPISAEQAIANAYEVIEQQSATFANDKALWRNDTWHPQISDTVPIGFGPKGWMASFGLYAYDCNNVGGTCVYPSSWDDYLEQLERQGEAHYDYALSFGDSEKFVGLTIHGKFEETSLPLGDRNASSDSSLFDTYYIGVDLSRHIGPDTSARIGIRNWLDIVEDETDFIAPKSAYGVISQRIRLRNKQDTWFSNAYLTAGVGNGEFRSVDQKFQASVAAQRSAGCTTYGYNKTNCPIETRLLANNRSVHYGELVPIGAVALEVYPGLNLIGEWRSGNLNAGLSIRPFEEIGFVFTGMFSSLIKNCDWGCTVSIPDVPEKVRLEDDLITNRLKLSVSATLNFKF